MMTGFSNYAEEKGQGAAGAVVAGHRRDMRGILPTGLPVFS